MWCSPGTLAGYPSGDRDCCRTGGHHPGNVNEYCPTGKRDFKNANEHYLACHPNASYANQTHFIHWWYSRSSDRNIEPVDLASQSRNCILKRRLGAGTTICILDR